MVYRFNQSDPSKCHDVAIALARVKRGGEEENLPCQWRREIRYVLESSIRVAGYNYNRKKNTVKSKAGNPLGIYSAPLTGRPPDMSPNIPYTLILSNAAIDFCREMQFQRLAQNCPSHPRARSAMSIKERSKNIPHHRLFRPLPAIHPVIIPPPPSQPPQPSPTPP